MRKLLPIISTTIFTLYLLSISGCATMNQSECQVANWEIIGLEDASAGRPSSYIGQHRSACAEYGIAPDLSRYMVGYEKGLTQYCTYQNGLNLGTSGRGYAGICKGAAANQFLQGYNQGKRDFDMRQAIGRLKTEISRHHQRLQNIDIQIDRKEDAIIASNTSTEDRRRLLSEIASLREEKQAIELELPAIEEELFRLEDEYSRMGK